ncbi:hypothetical protein P872_16990 [Rhodonellum psychrophilum GCM71 = DSM 17998]|uniref:Uncharacterized protein n=1 Tax=Rhodonellum psychrophilum GCM71 = DSM 17998 TaxID=1123057 RepID=U5C081_9BACT|nr:hypothetical protein P872_16990 [Rhodonellum psychrophilum GCM71 = DSM 17998]
MESISIFQVSRSKGWLKSDSKMRESSLVLIDVIFFSLSAQDPKKNIRKMRYSNANFIFLMNEIKRLGRNKENLEGYTAFGFERE